MQRPTGLFSAGSTQGRLSLRTILAWALLLLVAVPAGGWAAGPDTTGNNIAFQGSDTLGDVTKAILADATCAASLAGLGITYLGGGSTMGETAMALGAPTQQIAPMSRFLNSSNVSSGVCARGATAQGLVIGLDGVAIVVSETSGGTACGGALASSGSFQYTDTSGTSQTYALSETVAGAGDAWRDVLKLVFLGIDHTGARDCNGPVRKALIQDWARLFQTGCITGTCSQGLKHVYRLGDASGTTDAFLSSVGVPGLALPQVAGGQPKPNPFCNADGLGSIYTGESDYRDLDPIRIPCEAVKDATGALIVGDQVCSANNGSTSPGPIGTPGNLGLVQVVEVPPNLAAADIYPTHLCDPGKFALVLPKASGDPAALPKPPCPNGGGLTLGHCWQPYFSVGDTRNYNCIARVTPVQGISRNNVTDGRVYNRWLKDSRGRLLKDNFMVPADPKNFPGNPATTPRLVTGAFFRTHMDVVATGGGTTCQKTSSPAQLACLTQADPCTIGFAGRNAASGTTVAVSINGIANTEANIVKLLAPADSADFAARYTLSRRLYLNSLEGFANLIAGSGEAALAACFATNSIVDPIMASSDLIPMSRTTTYNPSGSIQCQDFDETASNGCHAGGPNTDSCATLPAGFIH